MGRTGGGAVAVAAEIGIGIGAETGTETGTAGGLVPLLGPSHSHHFPPVLLPVELAIVVVVEWTIAIVAEQTEETEAGRDEMTTITTAGKATGVSAQLDLNNV